MGILLGVGTGLSDMNEAAMLKVVLYIVLQ